MSLPLSFASLAEEADVFPGAGHLPGCRYAPAQAGAPCTHVHDDACGYVASDLSEPSEQMGFGDAPVQDALSGNTQAAPCRHVHDASCGYVPPTAEIPCTCAQFAAAEQEFTFRPAQARADADGLPVSEPGATEETPEANGKAALPVILDNAVIGDAPDGADGDMPPALPDEMEAVLKSVVTTSDWADFETIPVAPPLEESVADIVANAPETAESDPDGADAARQSASSFYVIIPGSLTLGADTSDMDITVDGVQDGETILLTFHSEHDFHLTDGAVAIPYSLLLDGTAVCAETAYACTVSGGCIRLRAEVEQPRFAGNYSDLLRFSISLPTETGAELPQSALDTAGQSEAESYAVKPPEAAEAPETEPGEAEAYAIRPLQADGPEEVFS